MSALQLTAIRGQNYAIKMSVPEPDTKTQQTAQRWSERSQWWNEYRKELGEGGKSQFEAYSKYLLTLSAGALVLSITFVKDIADPPTAASYLFVAWGGFITSIAAILAVLLVGYWSQTTLIMKIGDNWTKYDTFAEVEDVVAKSAKPKFFLTLHLISALGFVIGVVFLCLFAARNMS